ncbi:MAG: hypothetical protein GX800_05780 [Clostridiaceae bacterium]|jgi:hypothetical protein|nr:hypothetical protein [Clostridiaceae bacterium]
MSKNNYLAQLSAARTGQQQKKPNLDKAMADIRQYSDSLSGLKTEDLNELNELMDKVDGLADVFSKYDKLSGKIEALQKNAASIEASLGDLAELQDETQVNPFEGYTEEQTLAINVQLIKEFEAESRLSKDLLKLSESQILEEEVPEEVPAFEGLTKEQTVQVYMQVMDEFENKTELANRLAYNAEVE